MGTPPPVWLKKLQVPFQSVGAAFTGNEIFIRARVAWYVRTALVIINRKGSFYRTIVPKRDSQFCHIIGACKTSAARGVSSCII